MINGPSKDPLYRECTTRVDKEVQTSPSLINNLILEKLNSNSSENGDDSNLCSICFESWSMDSEHKLVSLSCGHLFGESCINKWISKSKSCPNCKASAKSNDIRKIYAKNVKAIDRSEENNAKEAVRKAKSIREDYEKEFGITKVNLKLALIEREGLKKILEENRKLIRHLRSRTFDTSEPLEKKKYCPPFKFLTTINLHAEGECRILAGCNTRNFITCSQKNSNSLFFHYGLRNLSLLDFKPLDFVPLHHNQIKDLSFHPTEPLILSSSLDKSVKLTNLTTYNVVFAQVLETDAWSCCWNTNDCNYFYIGLRNGKILEYDIRYTHHCTSEIVYNDNLPVSSLQYWFDARSDKKNEGILATHLRSSNLHIRHDLRSFTSYSLPIVGNFISSHFDSNSSHFLISSRPIKGQTNISHTIYELTLKTCENKNEEILDTNIINIFTGGTRADQVLRSKIFPNPKDEIDSLVIAGDQDCNGCLIWNLSNKEKLQEINCHAPVFDISLLKINSENILACLTAEKLCINKWDI